MSMKHTFTATPWVRDEHRNRSGGPSHLTYDAYWCRASLEDDDGNGNGSFGELEVFLTFLPREGQEPMVLVQLWDETGISNTCTVPELEAHCRDLARDQAFASWPLLARHVAQKRDEILNYR